MATPGPVTIHLVQTELLLGNRKIKRCVLYVIPGNPGDGIPKVLLQTCSTYRFINEMRLWGILVNF